MKRQQSFFVRIYDHEERGPVLVEMIAFDCESVCLDTARSLVASGRSTIAIAIDENEDATESMRVIGRFAPASA